MCITHWRMVPREIKRELNAAYRARGSNPDAPVSQRYADALVAAVRAVKTIEDQPPAEEVGDVCGDCNGRGGTITGEIQGDPDSHRTGYVEFYESCARCVDALLCPGCMRPAPTIDADRIDDFTCEHCGWSFDRSRFDADEPDYDDYDYTRDDFNFDAARERRSI